MTDLSPAPVQGTRYTGAELRALIAATESAIDAASSAGSEGINTVAQLDAAIAAGKPISVIKPEWWGAVADSDGYSAGTDNLAAFGDMFAWMKANPLFTWAGAQSSYQVELGHGNYYFSAALLCRDAKTFVMVGRGGGWRSSAPSTKLLFAAGCKGLVFDRGNTLDDAADDGDGRGNDGSHVRDLMVESLDNGTGTDGGFHGIQSRCQIFVKDVTVRGFRGHGVYIVANGTVADMPYRGSANCWMLINVSCSENMGDGVHVFGQDTNQGVMYGGEGTFNAGWGIYANCFLGSSFRDVHTSGNAGGAFYSFTNTSKFDFCYSEGNQPESDLNGAIAYGGLHGAGFTTDSLYIYPDGGNLVASGGGVEGRAVSSGKTWSCIVGRGEFEFMQASFTGIALPFTMRFYGLGGAGNEDSVALGHGYSGPSMVIHSPTATAGPPQGVSIEKLAVGQLGSGVVMTSGYEPPTTGTWARSSIIWNAFSLEDAPMGWVCIGAGTPGTWLPFGIVNAAKATAVSDPTGGTTVDAECRAQLAAVIDALQAAKLMI